MARRKNFQSKMVDKEEEIGSGTKVKRFAKDEYIQFIKAWGRTMETVGVNGSEQECEKIHLVLSTLKQEQEFLLSLWSQYDLYPQGVDTYSFSFFRRNLQSGSWKCACGRHCWLTT